MPCCRAQPSSTADGTTPGHRFNVKTGTCSTDAELKLKTYALFPEGSGFTVQG